LSYSSSTPPTVMNALLKESRTNSQHYSRDGDLATGGLGETSILHRFDIPNIAHNGCAFSLDRSLDLGVGGDGVIGRRVSFVHEQTVLGEGILGWN
jgi:hypothetical protein